MRYAILSDIHANLPALKRVLKDIRAQHVDKVICLGDVVGYGPDAEATVELVRKEVDVCLMGNHDAAVSGVITGEGFSMTAIRGVKRHRDETSQKSRDWLATLPYLFVEGDMACAHGDFSAPEKFNYIMTPLDALGSWATRKERVLFVGHTHSAAAFALSSTRGPVVCDTNSPILLEENCRYLVNVGSVGYPRYDGFMSWCIYDAKTKLVQLFKFPFDLAGFKRRMLSRGVELPTWVAKIEEKCSHD